MSMGTQAIAETMTQEMQAIHDGIEWFGNTYHYDVPEHMAQEDRLDETIPTAPATFGATGG